MTSVGGAIVAVCLGVVVVGCKAKDKAAPLPLLTAQAPAMTDGARVLGEDVAAPPVLVLVGPDGAVAVADAPRGADAWTELGTRRPRTRGEPVAPGELEAVAMLIREAVALELRIEPRLAARRTGEPAADVAIAAARPPLDEEDPPPPEEEEAEAPPLAPGDRFATTESKMGKQDSDRAEGQYRMKRHADDPALARARAIEEARAAGILGAVRDQPDGFGFGRSGGARPILDDPDPALPTRVAGAIGGTVEPGTDRFDVLVVASPRAPASALLEVVTAIPGALLAVVHEERLRALRVGFPRRVFGALDDARPSWAWIEVRLGGDGVAIEAVPGPATTVPWVQGQVDGAAVARAYQEARARLGEARRDVDVLVAEGAEVQHLVDALAALDGAGALVVSLGKAPAAGSPEAGKRGRRIASVRPGQLQVVGDLDKAHVRRRIREELPAIKVCYERAIASRPELAGTVNTQFFVAPSGVVESASANGVDPEVASCVADAVRAIEFPRPGGGGGAQVFYPFTFRY